MYDDKDNDERMLRILEDICEDTTNIDIKLHDLRRDLEALYEQKKDINESVKNLNEALEGIFKWMLGGFICILVALWWF